jgi:hypothetical protein
MCRVQLTINERAAMKIRTSRQILQLNVDPEQWQILILLTFFGSKFSRGERRSMTSLEHKAFWIE